MISSLVTPSGKEFFCCLEAPPGVASFSEGLKALMDEYEKSLHTHSLGPDTEVLLRFHFDDGQDNSDFLLRFLRERGTKAIWSFVGQPPASGSACCLEAYHMVAPYGLERVRIGDDQLLLRHGRYRTARTVALPRSEGDIEGQTCQVFDLLAGRLQHGEISLRDHLLRTWIYLRDIDSDYVAFNDARCRWFNAAGMTGKLWIPASTAIGAPGGPAVTKIRMDALAIEGLEPGQVTAMGAPSHLCPAQAYGVSFERGLKLVFGDRTHYYLSGTASIDRDGYILFPEDPEGQTRRSIENINALLSFHGAGLADLKQLVVYLRNATDCNKVRSLLERIVPSAVPRILLQGAVCRVPWLVEIEGIAMTNRGDGRYADYF